MTTEEFIKEAEAHLKHSNFKVLYGKVKIMNGVAELTSVYPISKDMKVLFGSHRILYSQDFSMKGKIYLAINFSGLIESKLKDFAKSLGHPTDCYNLMDADRKKEDFFFYDVG